MILNYLLEQLVSEAPSTLSDERQPWCVDNGCDIDGSNCDDEAIDNYTPEEWYELALSYTDAVMSEFSSMLRTFGPASAKRLISIKPLKSFKSKLDRGKTPCTVHDVLRGAILLSSNEEVEAAVKGMNRKLKIVEYESKDKGQDKDLGYYGSHHFKIEMSNGVIAEVQVMTSKLWKYKTAAHEIYDKWREVLSTDSKKEPSALKKDKILSKQIFALGNKNPKRRPNKKKEPRRGDSYSRSTPRRGDSYDRERFDV